MEATSLVSGQRAQTQQLNRRSRMETYCDIIKAIGGGAEKPTHIMYRANLSWTVMQGYIRSLEGQGLVQAQDDEGKRLYQLTERGFGLLKQYLSIKEDLRLSPEENAYL
ncbi:MAG: winged helix-turn-helix domain-containing protein [Nitrososphaerales archaeon]